MWAKRNQIHTRNSGQILVNQGALLTEPVEGHCSGKASDSGTDDDDILLSDRGLSFHHRCRNGFSSGSNSRVRLALWECFGLKMVK